MGLLYIKLKNKPVINFMDGNLFDYITNLTKQ